MLVIDLDLDDPRQVTVAWNVGADTVERAYRIGALILVRRSSRA